MLDHYVAKIKSSRALVTLYLLVSVCMEDEVVTLIKSMKALITWIKLVAVSNSVPYDCERLYMNLKEKFC